MSYQSPHRERKKKNTYYVVKVTSVKFTNTLVYKFFYSKIYNKFRIFI